MIFNFWFSFPSWEKDSLTINKNKSGEYSNRSYHSKTNREKRHCSPEDQVQEVSFRKLYFTAADDIQPFRIIIWQCYFMFVLQKQLIFILHSQLNETRIRIVIITYLDILCNENNTFWSNRMDYTEDGRFHSIISFSVEINRLLCI